MTNDDLRLNVFSVLLSLTQSRRMFTALDVSNKVKELMPSCHHKDVRDVVHSWFSDKTNILGINYSSKMIDVYLQDGTTASAKLYFPLELAWNTDEYDQNKRSQVAIVPKDEDPVSQSSISTFIPTGSDSKTDLAPPPDSSDSTPVLINDGKVIASDSTQVSLVAPKLPSIDDLDDPKKAWQNLFETRVSIFPRKS